MTPKSLLRLPAASSSVEDLTTGGFLPVIDDVTIEDAAAVKRIVLCSGKVYYDLLEGRKKEGDARVALVRVEQFYPFPLASIRRILERYPNADELVWAQEEPRNMGGWTFMEERLTNLLPAGRRPRYVGRSPSASPATGSYSIHQAEQAELVTKAVTFQ